MNNLKYLGKDGYPYIMGIPARDLTPYDLFEISQREGQTISEVVEMLCHPPSGITLYELQDKWVCDLCGKEYKTWDGYHRHTLSAHVETNDAFIISTVED